jgi:hypothetical protein
MYIERRNCLGSYGQGEDILVFFAGSVLMTLTGNMIREINLVINGDSADGRDARSLKNAWQITFSRRGS